MDARIENMLRKYDCKNLSDYTNAIHEIIQEIALLGLWREKFFVHAAFYGGTALRILYGLDRFSEDLDFSLLSPNANFKLDKYLQAIQTELASFGFATEVVSKEKNSSTNIISGFVKTGTKISLLTIEAPSDVSQYLPKNQNIKVKLEVDVNPPQGFSIEEKLLLQPIPFTVITYKPGDLFAGKIHALLCRNWQSRVKGRDWYDFVWYIAQGIAVNCHHLENRLRQSGHYHDLEPLTLDKIKLLLSDRIKQLDAKQATLDVLPYVMDRSSVEAWSAPFFLALLDKLNGNYIE
jgi:predicted nucleotidyltransferase component of viral defense system